MELSEYISQLNKAVLKRQHYRASLLSANLVEAGLSPDQVVVLRRKGEGKGVLHDIERISANYPCLNPDSPYIEIESGRLGAYDSMPEGVFFIAEHSQQEQDKRAIIERIRRNNESEKYIRQFMRLFEAESDYFRTHMNVEELKYDKCYTYTQFCDFYATYWPVISLMSKSEALRLMRLVSYIPSIRSQTNTVTGAMSFILGVDVKVEKRMVAIQPTISLKLREMRLGSNAALSDKHGKNKTQTIEVTISGMSTEQCKLFFEGRAKSKIVNCLCEMFLEVTLPVIIKIKSDIKSRGIRFSQSGHSESYLGVNTFLNK